ncbi:hypothetical protein ATE67_13010 [Sphingopyxis sp. H050]|uniref:DUF983 domain-containing protein n=1 Tax=Sphingopyxis sp. H050 TaxID=1759072 RepID=UPI0007369645|nr:DUF983 domain-containing protein [Sphingopyxis sp. H050]KTE19853.1 hypothetical protein ATE67_13010 [Sphingopyxis sp. H050]
MAMNEVEGRDKWRWIYRAGLSGLCPRCGEKGMFRRWLKVADRCPHCALDYEFAAPDDGPAFFSLCFIAFPLLFLVVWFEVALNPPWWLHVIVSVPLMMIPCLAVLQPIKGWLVASQYVNRAQEAGTAALWAKLNARAKGESVEVDG